MVENPTSEDSVLHKLTGTVVSVLYFCNKTTVLNHIELCSITYKTALNHGNKDQLVGTEKYNRLTSKDTVFSAINRSDRQNNCGLVSIDR